MFAPSNVSVAWENAMFAPSNASVAW